MSFLSKLKYRSASNAGAMAGDTSRPAKSQTVRSAAHAACEPLEARTLMAATKVMLLGDSITQVDSGHSGYRYWLYQSLTTTGYDVNFVGSQNTGTNGAALNYSDFDPDHEGHSGFRADDIASRAYNWALAAQPDVVVLHIGTNDAIQNQSASGTANDIQDIIGALRSAKSNVTIVLAQIIPQTAHNDIVNQLNSSLTTLASTSTTSQSRIVLVDQYSGFNLSTDSYDGTHPNENGEKKLAAKFYTALQSVLPSPVSLPAQPGSLSATVANTTNVTLRWTDNASDETGYRIERRAVGTNAWTILTDVAAGSTTYTNTGVSTPSGFQYRVLALKNTVVSAPSSEVIPGVSSNPGAPVDPTSLLVGRGSRSFVLNWTDNSTDETGFIVERATSGGAFVTIATVGANVTTFNDVRLIARTNYEYQIRAINTSGQSDPSDVRRVKSLATQGQLQSTKLSDIGWTSARNGLGRVETNASNGAAASRDGDTITLNGSMYSSGLGVYAGSTIVYDLGNGVYDRFQSEIGLDDSAGAAGSVAFQVWGDNELLFDSGVMSGRSRTKYLDVDVSAFSTLTLVVSDGGDGNTDDSATWAGALLTLV